MQIDVKYSTQILDDLYGNADVELNNRTPYKLNNSCKVDVLKFISI